MAFITRTVIVLIWLSFGRIASVVYAEYSRILMFREPVYGKIIPGHVIMAEKVTNEGSCRVKCFMEPNCVSINVGPADEHGGRMCELKNFTDESSSQSGLEEKEGHIHYTIEQNLCHSNPCPGMSFLCQVGFTDKGYRCVCRKGFEGESCKVASCSHLKKADPTATSGNYDIDPDGEGDLEPFLVYCGMADNNGVGVTVISHDSENRTFVHGFEYAGSYSRVIQYTGANLSQLASLTTVSSHCEQFIKYECLNAAMYRWSIVNWWVSRDSTMMTYWGGANISYKCACGMTDSCADPSYGCNCDANDGVWREDSGLLTDKTKLPVIQLRFGDTGEGNEEGYHTLGEFKCYGTA